MSVTDPIADMLTVLRNGVMAHKEAVLVKRSKLSENILAILKNEGFISNHKSVEDKRQGLIKVYLKYDEKSDSCLKGLAKISKPGLKVYVKNKDIKSVYGGIGVALISTSQGVMTEKEAKEKKLGGEVLCHIW
ncbi:30S ribosomal protein S8 [Candidatus Omnitrophota bacterium]